MNDDQLYGSNKFTLLMSVGPRVLPGLFEKCGDRDYLGIIFRAALELTGLSKDDVS